MLFLLFQIFPDDRDLDASDSVDASSVLSVPANSLVEMGEDGAVRVAFALYSNLHSVLPGRRDRFVNSRVLGATAAKDRNLRVSWPVHFTLKHLREEGAVNPLCCTWDYGRRQWSPRDCSVVKTNSTHTQCRCRRVSVYAVLAQEEEETPGSVAVTAVPTVPSEGKAAAEPHGTANGSGENGGGGIDVSTIIAAIVALLAVILVLVVAAVLARRFDLKPRMQKFVQHQNTSSGTGGTGQGAGGAAAGGGVFRCKKSESSTSSCGFYPPLTSSPTSTNVSSGTPTNQTTYLEQVLKAHGVPVVTPAAADQAAGSEFQQVVKPQTAMPQVALQQQELPGGGTIYRPANLSGIQQQQQQQVLHQIQPQQIINHGGRHLVALNQYDPFGHHIYMEIDPVYARLDAAVAAAAAAAAANNNDGASNNNSSSSSSTEAAAQSDIQLSDISDADDPTRGQQHHSRSLYHPQQQQQRFASAAEERPLIRRSADLLHHQQQLYDGEGNFVHSAAASPGPRQFLTSQRLQQHRELQQQQQHQPQLSGSSIGGNNNGSLRSGRTGHRRPRLQQQQQPLLYPVTSSQSQSPVGVVEDPISIALSQDGEQFVSLKIDQQKRQQRRRQQQQQKFAA